MNEFTLHNLSGGTATFIVGPEIGIAPVGTVPMRVPVDTLVFGTGVIETNAQATVTNAVPGQATYSYPDIPISVQPGYTWFQNGDLYWSFPGAQQTGPDSCLLPWHAQLQVNLTEVYDNGYGLSTNYYFFQSPPNYEPAHTYTGPCTDGGLFDWPSLVVFYLNFDSALWLDTEDSYGFTSVCIPATVSGGYTNVVPGFTNVAFTGSIIPVDVSVADELWLYSGSVEVRQRGELKPGYTENFVFGIESGLAAAVGFCCFIIMVRLFARVGGIGMTNT